MARGIRLVWWFIGTTLFRPAYSGKTGYNTKRMSQSASHHTNDANIIRDNPPTQKPSTRIVPNDVLAGPMGGTNRP